jgi:NAD(P)H-quinone oxidoreductase subunit 5
VVRTLQFLRAPSMLHDYRRMRSAIGGELSRERAEDLLPDRVRLWLYRWALDRGHLDTILDRWFIQPLYEISRLFTRLDGIGTARRPSDSAISLPGHAEGEVE